MEEQQNVNTKNEEKFNAAAKAIKTAAEMIHCYNIFKGKTKKIDDILCIEDKEILWQTLQEYLQEYGSFINNTTAITGIYTYQVSIEQYNTMTVIDIKLQLESGNIAVNGGGTLAEMEHAYIVDGNAPLAMIVTCEHHQRSHNADRFCLKYDVPLITTHLCAERLFLEGIKTHLLSVSESRLFVKYGCGISLIPVRYDSVDPFCLTIQDRENQIGVVPDGKIFPTMTKYLFDCDTVILGNRLHIPDNASSAFARRLKSVYNTQSELDEILKNYNGEIVYI